MIYMSWDASVFITPDQRWVSVDDANDLIVIEGSGWNRWSVRNVAGVASELTGAQIRSGFRHVTN